MYKFNFKSVDGTNEKSYDELIDFAREWTNGTLDGYEGGKFVTRDGITVITPANKHTEDAIIREILLSEKDHQINFNHFNVSNEMVLDAAQIPSGRKLAELMLTQTNPELFGNYIDTEIGRAFIINEGSPLENKVVPNASALEKAGLPTGSMTLKDTFIAQDKIANTIIVIDTRKEAESLNEITARAIEKGPVLMARAELDEGFEDDGVYAVVRFSGDPTLINATRKKLDVLSEENQDIVGYAMSGYANSKDNPLNAKTFSEIVVNHADTSRMINKQDLKDKKGQNAFTTVKVNRKLVNAAGSTENGIHVELNGKTEFFPEGSVLKQLNTEDFHINDFEQLSRNEVKQLTVISNEQENNIGGIPF